MSTLKVIAPTKSHRSGSRLRGLGVVLGIAIAAIAIYALTHTLKTIDTNEVFEVIRHTNISLIALAALRPSDSVETLLAKQLTPQAQEALVSAFVKGLAGRPN